MPNTHTLTSDPFLVREVIAFPRVDEFYNLLQDRLHMEVEGYFLEHNFTMYINALPRVESTTITRYQEVPLIYAGIPRQRELIEGSVRNWKEELDEHWDFLDVTDLNSKTAVVSSQLFKAFYRGDYKLSDIPKVSMGNLADYFEAILYPDSSFKTATPRQHAEYHILSSYFNVMEDKYLSIPLIEFGEFDGIVHLVYSAADSEALNEKVIAKMIKAFSILYENLILDWDLVGRNMEKSEAIQLSLSPVFYEYINKNPILKELKYDEYYKKYLLYFKERIRLNDRVIHSKVYAPYLKAAIISIMIDSYAHNISAHSLIALSWWFKRRADRIQNEKEVHLEETAELKEIVQEHLPSGYDQDRLFELITPWMQGYFVKDEEDEYDVVKFPGSLDREIYPLIKFLMQKGAFWSGIARDNHFGGESSSLFDVLWDDFINNPLYLGTIAKSEDIFKISLCFTKYAAQGKPSEDRISCFRPKELHEEGVFVEIDIKHKRPAAKRNEDGEYYIELEGGEKLWFSDHKELEEMSDFVSPGKDYARIKAHLKTCNIFFPGEVVGRHAFFTMLENEIRNVKHYKGADLLNIQTNGLKLFISTQDTNVRPNSNEVFEDMQNELYRIGVWIGTPTQLKVESMQPLVRRKFEALMSDIMDTDTFAPRLGGSFQDKICAGMLFNNKFSKVQSGDENPTRDNGNDSGRDISYFPWIIPATSPESAPHQDIEVCKKVKESDNEFNKKYNHERGYFKKYFHVWKAADIKQVSRMRQDDFVWENLARFRFVSLFAPIGERQQLWEKVRATGVIRIINQNQATIGDKARGHNILAAYKLWLREWISEDALRLDILIDGLLTGRMSFDKNSEAVFKYYNTDELSTEDDYTGHQYTLNLAHGGFSSDSNLLRYRSHGIYRTYFMREIHNGAPVSTLETSRLIELFEVLTTKISIFDNRIRQRIRNNDRENIFKKVLNIAINSEEQPVVDKTGDWHGNWEDQKQEIAQSQFLILHLSFIEKLLLTKYGAHPDYADENIGLFIQEELMPLISINGTVRKNFILVITSGRGRTKWWKRLEEKREYNQYTHFTIFRPIESIISGIEDALSRKEDIELKYNLCKILFGS
jgi:hypothetical protein